MTLKQIEKEHAMEISRVTAKYETAKKIRQLLDEARKAVPQCDADDLENEILDLITTEAT